MLKLPTNAKTFKNQQNHKSQIKYGPETSKVHATEFEETSCCSIKYRLKPI
jgi:hypothetical protein